MAFSNNVYQYVIPDGVIIPDTEVINQQVINEYQDQFGQDLIVTPNTPQGILISAETQARDGIAVNNATLANQINPNLAGGVFLDAICALTGIQRTVASFSTVVGSLTGVGGTIVPAGSQAQETVGQQIFQTVSSVTIPTTGSIDVVFQALNPGPIAVSPGTLTQIISVVLGWETVTNAAAANIGTDTQTDDSLRAYRKNTLAIQGEGLAKSILSGVYAVANVTSATFRENVLPSTQTIDGVTMLPNSVYLCVNGGADSDIAATLVAKKNGGCQYTNGAGIPVSVSYTEPFSGQVMNILFDRPTPIPVKIQVTIKVIDTLSDPQTLVQNAILNYAAGLIPGETGFTVGTSVSPFEIAGAINFYNRSIFVTLVEVSLQSPVTFSTNTLPITIFQIATIAVSDITVIIV
jgi:uncharacterized phage protein gp47/JayE